MDSMPTMIILMNYAEFKKAYHYNPLTGQFTRLTRQGRSNLPGLLIPKPAKSGYLRHNFCGKVYYAHRLAYFYMNGSWPENDIDHINGIRHDNRWENLRSVSRQINLNNINSPVKTPSGYRGVYSSGNVNSQKWKAKISINGSEKWLGTFDSVEEAGLAYKKAKREKLEELLRNT